MLEKDYLAVTNKTKAFLAMIVFKEVLPGYGITEDEYSEIYNLLYNAWRNFDKLELTEE